MLLKKIYMYITGIIYITVEGFGLKNFINACKSNNIILWKSESKNSVLLDCMVSNSDIYDIENIAKQTNCHIQINKKIGIPFLINRYKKRKIFVITFIVIAFFCFIISNFIWNISVIGNEKISNEEILSILGNHGITVGKSKFDLDLDKIINEIREERSDISWIGIKLKGTNAIVEIVEAIEKDEIKEKNYKSNIISDKSGEISKLIVRNGTARVNIGDVVNIGDILVEGVIEGKYTQPREVYSDADIFIKKTYEKERFEKYFQEYTNPTGNFEKNVEIYLNNFKINLNKGVSKFENYDTIKQYKKVKLFSNYYLPIEIIEIVENEVEQAQKEYTQDELKQKLKDELYGDIENEIKDIDKVNVNYEDKYDICADGINAKLICTVEEKVGTNE